MRARRAAALGTLLFALWSGPTPASTRLEPLVIGWEQYFKLSWEASARRGQPVVSGYISNEAGFSAKRIQLLVEGLDASGQVASQRLGWVAHPVAPGSRSYFEMPAPSSAPSYRVRVFAFDWVLTRD